MFSLLRAQSLSLAKCSAVKILPFNFAFVSYECLYPSSEPATFRILYLGFKLVK